jgi:uncharacterized protein YlxW (UPF0749 family)
MMKYEFEAIAGYEVSLEDYENVIEPMYMATELSKVDFVKCIDRKRFEVKKQKSPELVRMEQEIKEEIKTLKEEIKWYQQRIEQCNEYYKLDNDKAWKVNIKNYRMTIQSMKNRIADLRFVIA